MANIADFKSQMIGGGARPNQFRVELARLQQNTVLRVYRARLCRGWSDPLHSEQSVGTSCA